MQRTSVTLGAAGAREGAGGMRLASVRRIPAGVVLVAALAIALASPAIHAQEGREAGVGAAPATGAASVSEAAPGVQAGTVACSSKTGERNHCPADTSAGVALMRSTGTATCLLGKTWGYDDSGVWVSDGCSGEFILGGAESAGTSEAAGKPVASKQKRQPTERIEAWGEFEPGEGFLVGRSSAGELAISAYALVRYIDQMPAEQTFTDHLGDEHPVDNREDIYPHRVMIFLKGWLASPKLVYNIFIWTVNTTDQKNIFGSMGYQFSRKFSLYGGINGLPGTRSLQGSHPYWLGHDRVMADEFFRPYFTNGVWAQGEMMSGLWYNAMVGNNLSTLGVKATQLDRRFAYGASVWWMPTTKEFGPRGAYGDWEKHENIATRFGFSTVYSPEQSFADSTSGVPGNTSIRLADSLNVFDTGSLAPGVTVRNVNYRLLSIDAGMKYRGFFLQTEFYTRWLNGFRADGPLPVGEIVDKGFYVQAAFYPLPKKLELYAATSQIYGDSGAGFGNSSEVLAGLNFYPFNTRNHRLNLQIMDVNHSPVSSTFGYYTGGQNGTTVSTAFSVFF